MRRCRPILLRRLSFLLLLIRLDIQRRLKIRRLRPAELLLVTLKLDQVDHLGGAILLVIFLNAKVV